LKITMKRFSTLSMFRAPALALVASAISLTALAAPITGTVTNRTTGKPAAGDDVVLLSLTQNMQEAARVKTDSKGHFSLTTPADAPYLIRVDHQKAGYFHQAPPGTTTVDMDVYDVAAKLDAVSTEAQVLRVETDQQGLHVLENFFVKNDSNPPRTQLSDHSYELYLPEGAQIDGSAAMAPGGMPVSSSPVPLGDKGHYAFIFPLRPGETRFQLSYHIPYSGSLQISPKLAGTIQNFVVILPKSMTFKAQSPASYQTVNDDINAQTFLARNVQTSPALDFTLSGSGQQPRDTSSEGGGQAGAAGPAQGSAAADTRPGGGLGNPIDTPDPLNKYKWWILSGLAVILAAAAAFLLRSKPATVAVAGVPGAMSVAIPPAGSTAAASGQLAPNAIRSPVAGSHVPRSALLSALKDELFALETERLEGKLSEPEYVELKAAFETVLKRALARQG
jgi:5-hydroxyisourate hydrolase-like protein (transthyretin family)